jgi:hypothetical protein
MSTHSAKTLFDKNIESADHCLHLYDGVVALKARVEVSWILRAGIVFVVSALDTYFHDKVKYRVAHYSLENLPPALGKFEIPIAELSEWDAAQRKGNVLRNWVVDYLSTRPLQSPTFIADTLKLAGIVALWDTIEPDQNNRKHLLDTFNKLIRRRNQITHEGDRETSRRSGKKLRPVTRQQLEEAMSFTRDIVSRIENAFPK